MRVDPEWVEAAGDAVLNDLLDRNRLGAILDVMPEAEYAVLRKALGHAALAAVAPAIEAAALERAAVVADEQFRNALNGAQLASAIRALKETT